jgi:iron complex transport system substrate-binding protein
VRGRIGLAAVIGAVLALAGCAGGAPEAASTPQAPPSASAGTFPVTITHGLGSTSIPAAPQRIVALSGEEDTLAVLGIAPVALSEAYGTPGQRAPWLADQPVLDSATVLADTQSAVNIEQIAALRPDLILATNLYSAADVYAQLSRIAPTVAYPGAEPGTATWQELSLLVGRTVGREADAQAAVDRTEAGVRDMAAALPGLAGKTFTSSFYYEPGRFATIDSTETGAAALLASLDMELSPRVTAEVRDRAVSLEQIAVLDADFVAIGFAGDQLRTDLDASPLYANLPAVRDGRVVQASIQLATAGNNPSILNVPWQLEQYRPVLERVAG